MLYNALKIIGFVVIGLLLGFVMPFAEFIALYILDLVGAGALQDVFHGACLGDPWFSGIFVSVELTSLLLMARYNKIAVGCAVITSSIGTYLILNFMERFNGFAPS